MSALKIDFENRVALEQILAKLQNQQLKDSVPAVVPSDEAVERFAKLSNEQQNQILSNISTFIQICEAEVEQAIDMRSREMARVKAALKRWSLRPANDSLYDLVNENEIVEIYNLQSIQLYRNMYFFKVCSYSLLDLAVTPWQELYDKPKSAIDATNKLVETLFTSGDKPIPYGLPTYIQKENRKFLKSLKTVEVTPKFLMPLFNDESGKPAGVFSTYAGHVIAEGEESDRFSPLR